MDFFEQWDEAKWHFTYGDEDEPDKMVLQGGLVIVLYMLKSYLKGNRDALASAMYRIKEVFGDQLHWGYWEHPRQRGKYTRERFAECVEWVRARPATHAVELTWSSGAAYDFVGDYGLRAFSQMGLAEEEWKDLSYFQVYLPVEMLRGSGATNFELLVRDLASRLPVLHGYAGLGFQQSNEFHRYENLEFELAEQFLGFEVADILGHDELRQGIKSVNWYTILNSSWIEKLGGRDALARAVQDEAPNGISLLEYVNGVIVKAGDWPSLGWVERDPQPAAYVAANRVLKPVRVPELRCLHMGSILGEVRFDNVSSNQWLRRFDAPGIWPPSVNGGAVIEPTPVVESVVDNESEVPKPQPPSGSTLRAYPGQPCPQSGEWFSPLVKGAPVRVNKGELMPGPETTKQGVVTWYLRLPESD
ncbi:type VI immunity family protein [Burkholderia sp. LMG 32019]|uniref:type VI immunity family protein n=1 Tax=Burkholderia sp. LMG 32019 TaxID=3158173 RepID=UPI003C2CC844